MYFNTYAFEQLILAQMAETDRRARMAWMVNDRFAPRQARGEELRQALGWALLVLGRRLEAVGSKLVHASATGR